MSQFNEFSGVYSLILTPFNWDKTIDYKTYEEYVAACEKTKTENCATGTLYEVIQAYNESRNSK